MCEKAMVTCALLTVFQILIHDCWLITLLVQKYAIIMWLFINIIVFMLCMTLCGHSHDLIPNDYAYSSAVGTPPLLAYWESLCSQAT